MVDLEKLNKLLDDALSAETAASWKQRYNAFLFEQVANYQSFFFTDELENLSYVCADKRSAEGIQNDSYLLAA